MVHEEKLVMDTELGFGNVTFFPTRNVGKQGNDFAAKEVRHLKLTNYICGIDRPRSMPNILYLSGYVIPIPHK